MLLVLLLAVIAAEPFQTTDTIRKAVPFTVAADYDDPDAQGIRLYMNGLIQSQKTLAELGCAAMPCVVKFPFPTGLQRGSYVFFLEAFNAEGTASSATLTLSVTPGPPRAPLNLRIIK